MEKKAIARAAKTTLLVQFSTLALAAAVLGVVQGPAGALSAILGGIIAILPQVWASWRIVRVSGEDSKRFVAAFFFAEFTKIIIAAVLVFAAIKLFAPQPLSFVIAFALPFLLQWLLPILLRRSVPDVS